MLTDLPPFSDRSRIEQLIGKVLDRPAGTSGGRYRIEGVLGFGGTSWVLAVHHEDLDAPMALKLLRHHSSNNENTYAHFRQEARLLFKLTHPHIVRVFDAFTLADGDAFVMERLVGQSLWDACKDRPFSWRRACRLMLQCCSAVEALHAAGFVHRDLKPDNFMLTKRPGEDEAIKLIDLGISKNLPGNRPLAEDLTAETLGLVGTPMFMAPEVARGQVRVSVAADTYGLAATLFYLVSAQRPFEGDVATVLHACATSMPTWPPHLPEPVRALLEKGMGKKPELRFQSPQELAGALHRVLDAVPVAAAAPTANARPQRRGPLLVAAAAALVGAVVVPFSVIQREEPEAKAVADADLVAVPLPSQRTVPSVVHTVAVPTPSDPPAAGAVPALTLREQLVSRLPDLRACQNAPRGPVLFDLDRGLRRIDLGELDPADKWHACAARTLRRVRGRGQVDVSL
jgi:serine/threonine protein kinase